MHSCQTRVAQLYNTRLTAVQHTLYRRIKKQTSDKSAQRNLLDREKDQEGELHESAIPVISSAASSRLERVSTPPF
ncbi:MAG: hypothetical protein ACRCZY_08110 [Phocaeicola sp.]